MEKRILTIVLTLFMAFTLLTVSALALEPVPVLPPLTLPDTTWDGTSDQVWSGAGTQANPYLITRAEELAGLAGMVNLGNQYKDTYFKLTADIQLNNDSLREWTPIGSKNHLFRGIFDGDSHTVSGLYINKPNNDWLGLFGRIGTGGIVKNLGIMGGLIYGSENVGSVAGCSSGLIQSCYSTGEIYAKGDYVGGIVGQCLGSAVDCYNTGKITGVGSSDNFIGGVTGYNCGGIIVGCYNTGEVTGRFRIGGIAGRNGGSGIIFNCWNKGNIISTMHETGGITGHNGPQCIVANCYNTGDVEGSHRVGGITGYNYAGVTINCYNTGYITGDSGEYGIGAVVGYNDDSATSGTGFLGGFDVADKAGYVVNCYWLAGCIDAGRKSGVGSNDPNCSIIGVGKFSSSASNIVATDTGRGGSSTLSEFIEGAVSLGLEVGIDLVYQAFDLETPDCLKNINIEIDTQAAFSGNSTTYYGTLLEVLNQGFGADETGNYGMWYQYSDTNGGYPVLIEKTNPIFTPLTFTLCPIFTPFIAEIEEDSAAEEAEDSVSFTLSDRYPMDNEVRAGETTGFSTSLAAGSANPGNLNREWHFVDGDNDYYISEDIEINSCSFELVNDNYLKVTAAADAVSAEYKIYCIVSNESGTKTSRLAVLTVHGTESPASESPATESPASESPASESPVEIAFVDVADNAWYRNDVVNAVHLGLINGTSATTYSPGNNLSYAEAIKLAACMHQFYHDGSVTLTGGNPWYQTYVDYAFENGIITSAYADYNAKITRQEFVHIFYAALPASEYAAKNTVAAGAIPDVPMTGSYAGEIYTFYRAGILTGSDSAGTFNPTSNILRSEVAAILTRMFDDTTRKSITL